MIKKLLIFVVGLIAFLLIVVAVLTFNLDKILKPSLLAKYQKEYVPNLMIDWSKVDIDVENIGLFSKEVSVKSKAQCVIYKSSEFCHESFLARVMVTPFKSPILQVLEVKLINQINKVNLVDFQTEEKKPWSSIQSQIHNYLKLLKSNFKFMPENFTVSSEGVVNDGEASMLNYALQASKEALVVDYKTEDLSIKIRNVEELDFTSDFVNKLEIKFETSSVNMVSYIKIEPFQGGILSNIKLSAKFKSGRVLDLNTSILTELDSKQLKLSLQKLETEFEPYLKTLKVSECVVIMRDSEGENVNVECLKNSFIISTTKFEKKWSKKNVEDLGPFFFQTKASLNEKVFMYEKEGDLGSLSYRIDEKKGAFFTFASQATLDLLKADRKISLEPKSINLNLHVFSYEKMVKQLEQSPYAIPAPLNAYNGDLKISTEDLLIDDKIKVPFVAKIKLVGGEDSEVNLEADGSLDLTLNAKGQYEPLFNMDILLGENVLYLPNFDPLSGLPKLTTDPRIVHGNQNKTVFLNTENEKNKKTEKSTSGFKYNVKIKTKNVDSIKVKYKLFEPYVPLGLEAKMSHKGMTLNLFSKKTWAVEYLKRKVYISKMSISKRRLSDEDYFVDALLVYKASEYDIFIKAVGNVDAPAVSLRSDPPLSRSDIISVLLYNRTANDIDRFQSESVGGAEAAFSDKALGLIGIWAFASTPIESVSYDSRSQTYRAQIALPGGVKFDIGTDWERVQNLSLRKRVSKYWMVVTSYQPGNDENEGIGDVLIQREWIF